MHRLTLSAALLVIFPACGSDADGWQADPESPDMLEASAQWDRPVQAGEEEERSPAMSSRGIPAGTLLTFEVREEVSTDSHEAGDAFDLVLVDPVAGEDGATLNAGAAARGVVTEALRSTGTGDISLLVVRVSTVEAEGFQAPIEGQIQSTAIGQVTQASGARTLGTMATGAAAGAVIGQVLGGTTRALRTGAGASSGADTGTASGAGMGLIVAVTSHGGHSTLAQGTRIVVRLDRALGF